MLAGELTQFAVSSRTDRDTPHLVPLVRAGATFTKGKLVERDIKNNDVDEAA